jgi:FMN phosphatase YigB (HAD superfamily)
MSAVMNIKAIFFDLGDTLVRNVSDPPADPKFEWLPGVPDLLRSLRARDLEVGLLSNTGSLDRASLEGMLPADFDWDLFDSHLIVLSSEVGIKKPDPRIFRLASVRAQQSTDVSEAWRIVPQQILFCGESLNETLVAQRVGMLAAWVGSDGNSAIGHLFARLSDTGMLG